MMSVTETRPFPSVLWADPRVPGWHRREYPWIVIVSTRVVSAIEHARRLGLDKSEWRWASRGSQTSYFPVGQPFVMLPGFQRDCPPEQRRELEWRLWELRAVQLAVR